MLKLLLLAPLWVSHFIYRRFLRGEENWSVQKSLSLVWYGGGQTGERLSEEYADIDEELRDPVNAARICLEYGRYKHAMDILEPVLKNDPDNVQARFLMDRACQLLASDNQ